MPDPALRSPAGAPVASSSPSRPLSWLRWNSRPSSRGSPTPPRRAGRETGLLARVIPTEPEPGRAHLSLRLDRGTEPLTWAGDRRSRARLVWASARSFGRPCRWRPSPSSRRSRLEAGSSRSSGNSSVALRVTEAPGGDRGRRGGGACARADDRGDAAGRLAGVPRRNRLRRRAGSSRRSASHRLVAVRGGDERTRLR